MTENPHLPGGYAARLEFTDRHRVEVQEGASAFPGGKPLHTAVCACGWRGNPTVDRSRASSAADWHLRSVRTVNLTAGQIVVDANDMTLAADIAYAIDEALQSAGYTGGALVRNGMTGWGEIVQHAILDALREKGQTQ